MVRPDYWRRSLSVFWVFSTCFVLPAAQAQVRASGHVVNADSVPLRNIPVVLHQIGRQAQGPMDSTRSDQRGRFHFVFRPDTSALYLTSARYAGIEYFSSPLATNPGRPDTSITIIVFDTSAAAPVRLAARHLVVTRPGADGARSVLDLIILRNAGRLTRVASDTLHPSVSLALPHGTTGLEIGESDLSSAAIVRRQDSLLVNGAISPGEKQLTIQYLISPSSPAITLPVRDSGVTFNVLIEEVGTKLAASGLSLADSQVIQGRSFRRWTGVPPAPSVIHVILPGRRSTPTGVLLALVGVIALALGGAAVYLVLHRPGRMTHRHPDALVAAIAALDARYLGKEEETAEADWNQYQTERARLKAELEASLAASGWSP